MRIGIYILRNSNSIKNADDYCKNMIDSFEKICDKVECVNETGIKSALKSASDCDELVIVTSECIGPFYNFENMFENMKNCGASVWGASGSAEKLDKNFLVFGKDVIKSGIIAKFYKKFDDVDAAKHFRKNGFEYAVYADYSDVTDLFDKPWKSVPRYIIEEKKCPVMPVDILISEYGDVLKNSAGESVRDVIEFIDKFTDYDVSLIWSYLINNYNQADIKKNLQDNYVFSSKTSKGLSGKLKVALMLHIYYQDLIPFCHKYAWSMPEGSDIYVTVPDDERKTLVEEAFADISKAYKLEVRVVGNIGRDVAPFLVGCKDVFLNYDLVCKVHDKKVRQLPQLLQGHSWGYMCFENTLRNRAFVENVINRFESDSKLGMLMPPIPNHGPFYTTTGMGEWRKNYATTHKLVNSFVLDVDICEEKEPIAPFGSMFWVRTDALKKLFERNWEYKDFPKEPITDDDTILHAIERVYPFFVQDKGYRSGWLVTDMFFGVEEGNLSYYNRRLVQAEEKVVGVKTFNELLESVMKIKVK